MRRQNRRDASNRIDGRCDMPLAQSRFSFNGLVIGFALREFDRISTAC